jgi:hypothetical protein
VVARIHFLNPLGVLCFELVELVGVLLGELRRYGSELFSQGFFLFCFILQATQVAFNIQSRVIGGFDLRFAVQDILLSFLGGSSRISELVCVIARSLPDAFPVISLLGRPLYALSLWLALDRRPKKDMYQQKRDSSVVCEQVISRC